MYYEVKRVYIYKIYALGKYIFTSILLFIFLFGQITYAQESVSDDTAKEECKTCSGPSDEMMQYRDFLQSTIDSITIKKPSQIIVEDNVKWLSKNADSAIKGIVYSTRANTKTSFRKTLYNGKDTVFWMQDFVKNLISIGNITKLRELQALDRYSDIIDQLSLKLIETKQYNSQISDSDMVKIKDIFDKYSNWDTKIFAAKISENLKWKKYSEVMKFLLSLNNKMQWFVLNGKMKTINTEENSENTDLVANRDIEYIKKITESYACSRWINKCDRIKTELKKISDGFKTNMKNQKTEVQIAVNDLKIAMGKFNNVVLWVKDPDYGSDLSDTATDKKWWFLNHFEINKNIDSKIQDLITPDQDAKNKINNSKAAQKAKEQIVNQEKEKLNESNIDFKININNKQNDLSANNLAIEKNNINDFVDNAIEKQYDFMDKNILAESESITKTFPSLSQKVYSNISTIWHRSQDDSPISNFVAMCEYQCQNLWWKCEPRTNKLNDFLNNVLN